MFNSLLLDSSCSSSCSSSCRHRRCPRRWLERGRPFWNMDFMPSVARKTSFSQLTFLGTTDASVASVNWCSRETLVGVQLRRQQFLVLRRFKLQFVIELKGKVKDCCSAVLALICSTRSNCICINMQMANCYSLP